MHLVLPEASRSSLECKYTHICQERKKHHQCASEVSDNVCLSLPIVVASLQGLCELIPFSIHPGSTARLIIFSNIKCFQHKKIKCGKLNISDDLYINKLLGTESWPVPKANERILSAMTT